MLAVENLHKRYGATVAVESVTFAVAEGEIFGLLGPNGAGKTTTLSILSGLLEATGGHAMFLGRPITTHARALRPNLGIVPQELALYGELTARENLEFFGELYGMRGTQLSDSVNAVLETIGLADRANQIVSTFSGGMKRRLNLGAALVHRPKLLLLDEPTTGVDPQSRNHLFEEIKRINREGMTIVYTSHYMEEVQTLCSRVGIIDHGRVIACDTLVGLLKTLQGLLRFHVSHVPWNLLARVRELPGVLNCTLEGSVGTVACDDVKATLIRLVSLLSELQIELHGLESEVPNLERVFLHLTGRELRD